MITARTIWVLALGVMAFSGGALAKSPAAPLPSGSYCLKEKVIKDWEPGPPEIGHFEMFLQVGKTDDRHRVSFWNVEPFGGPILEGSTGNAKLLADGSLEFAFVDGWDNEGRALVKRDGRVVLTKTKASARDVGVPDGNYASLRLTRAACADKDFKRYR
jgi:hypothetical protein